MSARCLFVIIFMSRKFILGKKIGMSQIFEENGKVIPVSLIQAGPCYITQIRNLNQDAYTAVQIGFSELKKEKKIKKSLEGQMKKIKKENSDFDQKGFAHLKEFSIGVDEIEKWKLGDQIKADVFQESDKVKVRGVSKGKGFQGWVKRYGFAGGPASHGNKHSARQRGSIGSAFPERVLKGTKMAGRMGGEKTTIRNLKIVKIDLDNNIIAIKGAIPGKNGSVVEIFN